MHRKLMLSVLALVAILIASACGSSSNPNAAPASSSGSAKPSGPIVIGAAVASTGFMISYDNPDMDAVKLAVREQNAAGGIDGRKIKVITDDTQSTPAGAKTSAQNLIQRGAQLMLVTSNFDVGSPAGIAAQNAGLLNVSIGAASPKYGVQGIGPLAYTPAPPTYLEGASMAQLAYNRGWRKAFMLDDTSLDYSSEQCVGFKQRAAQLGMTLTSGTFQNSDKSIASQITQIQHSGAQAVALCSYTPGGATAVRQIRAAGVNLPLLSGIGMAGTYWLKAAPNLSNMYVVSSASMYGDDPNPAVNAWVKTFIKTYGAPPSTDAAINAYSITKLIFQAITATGGTNGAKLSAWLDKLHSTPTLGGPVTFTPMLHLPSDRPLEVIKYTDGKPHYDGRVQTGRAPDLHL